MVTGQAGGCAPLYWIRMMVRSLCALVPLTVIHCRYTTLYSAGLRKKGA